MTCAAPPRTNAKWPASGPNAPCSSSSTEPTKNFAGRTCEAMYDVAIVGGGPAGASAATFTARAGLQTVLIDADAGMTRRAMVNNHLGFPDGVAGPDLVENGKAQAAHAGAEVVAGKAVELLSQGADGFAVKTE